MNELGKFRKQEIDPRKSLGEHDRTKRSNQETEQWEAVQDRK
jgi:hypothetical protein